MPSTVSALIVSWNNREFLGRCLESLPKGTEIVVVDNASDDGSADFIAETFPDVKLIRLDQNVGFAAAVNRGAAETTGTYLLLLNPDAEATPKSVERLVEFLDEHVTCGAATGRLLSMTEDWQRTFNVRRLPTFGTVAADLLLLNYVWPTNPLSQHADGADITDQSSQAVEQPAAICLMGQNCGSHVGFLQKTLGFAEDHPGFQELLRGAANGLGAIGAQGNAEAVTILLDVGIPSQDPVRAPVALALGMVAVRNTKLLLDVLAQRPDRAEAISLIAEGFDMLEEDLEEERFFATVRRTYWSAPEGSPTRGLCEQLITTLHF